MRKKNLILGFVAFLTIMSCEDTSPEGMLSPEVRYMADTMFSKRKLLIIKELDSLCQTKEEEWIINARDSLLKIELKRIRELTRIDQSIDL